MDNESIFWKWMESVLDEKIKDSSSTSAVDYEDPIYKSSVLNINEQEIDRLKISREKFNHEKLKLEKTFDNVDDNDEFLSKFKDKIDEFENKIELEFKNILNSSTIKTKTNNRPLSNEMFNFNLQKLNLIKSKSKDSNNYQTVSSKFSNLEKKIKNLETKYKIQKEKSVEKCEKIANNLQDCLIITADK